MGLGMSLGGKSGARVAVTRQFGPIYASILQVSCLQVIYLQSSTRKSFKRGEHV
jgi:hypothetical protein